MKKILFGFLILISCTKDHQVCWTCEFTSVGTVVNTIIRATAYPIKLCDKSDKEVSDYEKALNTTTSAEEQNSTYGLIEVTTITTCTCKKN